MMDGRTDRQRETEPPLEITRGLPTRAVNGSAAFGCTLIAVADIGALLDMTNAERRRNTELLRRRRLKA